MRSASEHSTSFLILDVDARRLAVPAGDVVEIVRAVAIAPLPGAPRAVSGVVDVRGTVVPVIDLRRRLDFPDAPLTPDEHFVLVRASGRTLALRVDHASAVEALADEHIQDAAEIAPGARFLTRIARSPDGLVLIHDVATFLSGTETIQLDRAIARLPRPEGG